MGRNHSYMLAGLTLALSVSLTGCGGGGEGDNSSASQPGTGNTGGSGSTGSGDIVTPSGPRLLHLADQGEHTVEPSRFMTPQEELVNVQTDGSPDNVCSAQSSSELTLNATGYGLCHLQLTFEQKGEQNGQRYERPLTINYTSTPNKLLPALSEVFEVGQHRTIDLTSNAAIKSFFDDGYSLQPNALKVSGSITAEGHDTDANGSFESINISSGDVLGPNRITYVLEKENADVKTGVIDVTVSASPDSAPTVVQPNYTWVDLARAGDVAEINLLNPADKIVSDPDNEADLRLVSLSAPMGGTVTAGPSSGAKTGLDAATTTFRFSADVIGEYQVNYTVSDQQGGYASGVVNINVGRLTSPNSPETATPGRMVEWTTVGEPPNQLVVNRPVLLKEVSHYLGSSIPDTNKTTQNGEEWAYTTRTLGAQFCDRLSMKLITATGFKALREKYPSYSDGFISDLGWPVASTGSTSPGEALQYLIQETDHQPAIDHFAINALTGAIVTEPQTNEGLVICVRSPEVTMTYDQPAGITGNGTEADPWLMAPGSVDSPANQLAITLNNVKGSGTPTCTSSDPDVVTASCSPITESGSSTLTITAQSALSDAPRAITVRTPDGENLIGSQPRLMLYVRHDKAITTGVPSLPTYKISSTTGEVVSNSGTTEANRLKVRPGSTLTVDWTYVEPDVHQRNDATIVEWTNATPTSANQATVDGLGTVSVTLTPRSQYQADGEKFEVGTPVTLSFAVSNEAPVISNLDITSNDVRGGTAFDQNTTVIASYQYSDVNNDAESHATYVWEHKRPWSANWTPLVDASGQPVTTRDVPLTNEFFDENGLYEGNDLGLRMMVTDDQGGQSAHVVQLIYPVAQTETDTITIRPLNDDNPLVLHRQPEAFLDPFLSHEGISRLDAFCQFRVPQPPPGSYTQMRVLRSATIDELMRQNKIPRYWHSAYVTHPKIPYDSGRSPDHQGYVWNAATGVSEGPADVKVPGVDGSGQYWDMTLLCEEVLLDDLQLFPPTAQTVLGRDLLIQWGGKNTENVYLGVDPTPASGLHGVTRWISSNEDVATINAEGVVTPHAVGTTMITSTFMGITKTLTVTVKPAPTTLKLCGGAINDPGGNSYNDCLKVGSTADGYFTGPFSDIVAERFGLSHDPSGLTPYSYQGTITDYSGYTHEKRKPFTAFHYATDGARFRDWCNILSGLNFQGRNNWQPATLNQLNSLYSFHVTAPKPPPSGAVGLGANTLGWAVREGQTATDLVDTSTQIMTAFRGINGAEQEKGFRDNLYVSCYAPNPPK